MVETSATVTKEAPECHVWPIFLSSEGGVLISLDFGTTSLLRLHTLTEIRSVGKGKIAHPLLLPLWTNVKHLVTRCGYQENPDPVPQEVMQCFLAKGTPRWVSDCLA